MDQDEMTQDQIPTSTLKRSTPKSHKKPNLAAKKMVGPNRKAKPRSRKQRILNRSCLEVEEEVNDKAEVEQKIVALQRIVPGGEELGVDRLFEETAGYIMSLQCQVKAMRALASFIEGLEKENRMFGG